MSSSSDSKDFRQLEYYFNIIFDPSSSEDRVMNIRSKIGITLFFCCVKDSVRTLDIIVQKMETTKSSPRVSIILLSSICYAMQFIPNFNPLENSRDLSWAEAPFFKHAVLSDANSIFNLTRFFQAGGSRLVPFPDVFLCELLLRYETIGISITAKPISLLIDLNPETNSSIFWRLLKTNYDSIDNFFNENESFLTLVSKVTANSSILPPKEAEKLSLLIQACEQNCQTIESEKDTSQLKFNRVEISLSILRWLVSNQCYCPDRLLCNYTSKGLDCLVIECWSEYAKYGDLSKLPKFKENDTQFLSIYVKVIKNLLLNPTFSFEKVEINHWLWKSIVNEFLLNGKEEQNVERNDSKHSLYDLSNNELLYCSDIACILPEWFFIHCLRFKCRNSEVSVRILKIVSEIPTSILISNFDDFIDFIMFHITSFPQNANMIANCIRDLISVLLPRMNPLIERIVYSIDYFDEANLTPRLTLLNNIFCFGVETESFVDVFDGILESLPLLDGSISLSFCLSLFRFFSLVSFYQPKNGEILFNISMAVLCAAYSSCAMITSYSSSSITSSSMSSGVINSCASMSNIGSSYNLQLKRTMSTGSVRGNNNMSPPPMSPLFMQNDKFANQGSVINTSFSIADGKFPQISGRNDMNSILNEGHITTSSSTFSVSTVASSSVANGGADFMMIDEPSFVSRCEHSHSIYSSCMRFFSVIQSDIVINPKYRPSDSFSLVTLALQLIQKLPINLISKNTEGISMLIDFLPSFLPLFPVDVVSITNFLIESDVMCSGKHLSMISSQLKQELTHSNSFNLILHAIKFVSLTNQDSIDMKPVNVKSLPDDINSARQAIKANPEIIPLVIMKTKHLSLLLELDAPKIDISILYALSAKLSQSNSCHEVRQIRSFLAHFNFKQPECFKCDSWLRRDFSTEETRLKRENAISKELLNKNCEGIEDFQRFYPVDTKLDRTELMISIMKNYKFCPELANIICSLVSDSADECVKLGKDKFWLLKFLFVHKVKYQFPQDTENMKCIEFGLRNGFLPRSLVTHLFNLDDDKDNKNESEVKEFEEVKEIEEFDENEEIEEWVLIDRLYLLLPSEIEAIWPNFLADQGRILCSHFLPKQTIISKDFLLKLIMSASSLPSQILSSSSSSSSPSSPFFSTIPSSVCQHILEYLLVFASNYLDEAEQFFSYNDGQIVSFMCRIDIQNSLVFEALFTFVNSIILMFGNGKKNNFVIKFAEVFLKIVFSFDTGIYSSCIYEVLPLLKKIIDVFNVFGKKLKSSDTFVQFLICLKKGIPSVREYIPNSLPE